MSATWPQLVVEAGFGLPARAASTWPLANGDNATFQRGIGSWVAYYNCTVGWALGIAPAPYRASVALTCTGAGTSGAGFQLADRAPIAGLSYTATVRMRGATVGRSSRLNFQWDLANGSNTVVNGPAVTTTTSGWTTVTVTSTAPSGVIGGYLFVEVSGAASSERHYVAAVAGDTTTPRWTDITRWVRGKVSLTRSSRQYELGRFEAGTASVKVDNSDGRFTFGNTSSPYYPHVRPIVPIRIRAIWNGDVYPRWAGVVERWPLSWDDPALSLPEITCVDSLAVLSQGELRSTYEEEVLLDDPSSFFPLVENQKSTSAGDVVTPNTAPITPSKYGGADSDFSGEAIVYDGASSLDLNPGGTPTACDYLDLSKAPGMQPSTATGWTLELWSQSKNDLIPDTNSPLFSHLIAGTNSPTGYQIIISRTFLGQVSLAVGGTIVYNSPVAYWGNGPMYFCITLDTSGVTRFYVNGNSPSFSGNVSLGRAATAAVLGADWYSSTSPRYLFEGLASHLAFYKYQLSEIRIGAHRAVGQNGGFDAERTGSRVNRILNYGRWPSSLRSVQLGDSIAGTANGYGLSGLAGQSTLAASQDTSDAEAGQLFTSTDGTVVFEERSYRPSQSAPRNVWDGQFGLPYQLDGLGFDVDPTYIYNTVKLTRDGGPTQSATDDASANLSLPRTYSATLKLRDDSEVAGRTNLYLSLYKDPRLRLSGFSFRPSDNPTVLFLVALTMDISDWQRLVHRPIGAPAIPYDGYIDAISEEIAVETGSQSWTVTCQLSPALTQYWQLAAARSTAVSGAGAGATALTLTGLSDRMTNQAVASWASGLYDVIRAGARVGQISITAVGATVAGYSTFTVSTAVLPFAIQAGDTVCSPLPPTATSPTVWDARSVLGSTTRLSN